MDRTCADCGSSFGICTRDLAFYDRISPTFVGRTFAIPPPEKCPDCRFRERLIWRPELHVFQRKSDFSGKQILSMYPPEAACKVYSPEEWWSDAWDPMSHGREFDFNRPFFEQFAELVREVPLRATSVDGNENCDYVNSASWNRNCYLIAAANHNEDCYYGNFVNYCRDCLDCSFIDHCELCYECIDCEQSYNLQYCQNCSNCSDSAFLHGCRGCKHCFGCVNLADREYVFLNEQLSREEYERRLAECELLRRSRVEEARVFFEKHRLTFPHRFMIGEMNEDVSGNAILRSRRAYHCFEVSDLEDCSYCSWFHQSKNCMDCYAWGFPVEESYACMEVGAGSNHVLFSCVSYNCSDAFYSYTINSCRDVFGCVSLRQKRHCILNRQYSQEEYETLVPRIIEHMQKTPSTSSGQAPEWGRFFPMSICPLSYNQTIAQDYFPLVKEDARKLGATWTDESPVIPPAIEVQVPDSIDDVQEDILGAILTCEISKKAYKLIPQEYRFLKQQRIPVPLKSMYKRHLERLRKRNPRKLWKRECDVCHRALETTYAPDRPETIYCDDCYRKEVY